MDASGIKQKSYLFDLGHPAHVHYFKRNILALNLSGARVTVIARDKDVAHELLRAYGIEFISRGKGGDSIIEKIVYFFLHLGRHLRQIYGPHDTYIGYASFYIAIASFFLRKKSIILDDTESGYLQRWLYLPFASKIIVPNVFTAWTPKRRTIRLKGVFEELYMTDSADKTKRTQKKLTCLLRFVKWNANHDVGLSGISNKERMIELLKEAGYKIYVSSETGVIPDGTLKLNEPVEKFHSFLANCDLYVGESATVASEACAAGVYSIYFDKHGRGYTNYWENENRLSWFQDFDEKLFLKALLIAKNNKISRHSKPSSWVSDQLDKEIQ